MGDGYKRAWEDGHLVYPNSPEADFYRETPGGKWCEDVTGAYVINPAFRDRGYGAGFGFDWGNIGTFFTGFFEGFGKGGGDLVTGFIQAGASQSSKATSELKAEILAVRARWCADRGIVISGTATSPVFTPLNPGQVKATVAEFESFRAWLVRVFGKDGAK